MVLTEDDDYLRGYPLSPESCDIVISKLFSPGSITGRCTVDDESGYLVNTGGREPLRLAMS